MGFSFLYGSVWRWTARPASPGLFLWCQRCVPTDGPPWLAQTLQAATRAAVAVFFATAAIGLAFPRARAINGARLPNWAFQVRKAGRCRVGQCADTAPAVADRFTYQRRLAGAGVGNEWACVPEAERSSAGARAVRYGWVGHAEQEVDQVTVRGRDVAGRTLKSELRRADGRAGGPQPARQVVRAGREVGVRVARLPRAPARGAGTGEANEPFGTVRMSRAGLALAEVRNTRSVPAVSAVLLSPRSGRSPRRPGCDTPWRRIHRLRGRDPGSQRRRCSGRGATYTARTARPPIRCIAPNRWRPWRPSSRGGVTRNTGCTSRTSLARARGTPLRARRRGHRRSAPRRRAPVARWVVARRRPLRRGRRRSRGRRPFSRRRRVTSARDVGSG